MPQLGGLDLPVEEGRGGEKVKEDSLGLGVQAILFDFPSTSRGKLKARPHWRRSRIRSTFCRWLTVTATKCRLRR